MIGRKSEISELRELYDSNKAELIAIYGRRRVGKTYLGSWKTGVSKGFFDLEPLKNDNYDCCM